MKTKKLTPKDKCNKLAADIHMLYESLLTKGFTCEQAFELTHKLLYTVSTEFLNE